MKPEDFTEFFEALHGYQPFIWQRRLAGRVFTTGCWPEYIAMPTSAGKTAALDIALFHMALAGNQPLSQRSAPRRIFFVVDRRLIVDEAYDRSFRIAEKLKEAYTNNGSIVGEVARLLGKMTGEDASTPLTVKRLRGGLPRERAFIRDPLQPTIIISTVDQIGSRLLFRGYGVSEFMRPIHAALVGVDSLIILDEAHLSKPFTQTLHWIRRYQSEDWAEKPLAAPATIVHMTATPPKHEEPFGLEKEDWGDEKLVPRLTAAKPAQLIEIKTDPEDIHDAIQKLASSLCKAARHIYEEQVNERSAPVIGIIANRVTTARMVFEQIKSTDDCDAILLIGRTRPYERDNLLEEYKQRICACRAAEDNQKPLFVIATQTIEVGADLDFDGLVTEAAPLDALRQRFGRLNRLGTRNNCRAIIIFDKAMPKDDPIYGGAIIETWKRALLPNAKKRRGQKNKEIDFGIEAMDSVLAKIEDVTDFNAPVSDAPILMPAHMDMLIQTNPVPAIEPDLALYLHGANEHTGDVQIIWRADIPDTLKKEDTAHVKQIVRIMPPSQQEALSLPLWAARNFLIKKTIYDLADIEGTDTNELRPQLLETRKIIRWNRKDDIEFINPSDIRAGDTIFVSTSAGGLDRYGWNPQSKKATDIAELALEKQRGRTMLRYHPALLEQWFTEGSEDYDRAKNFLESTFFEVKKEETELEKLCDALIENILLLDDLKPDIREKLIGFSDNESRISYLYPTPEPSLVSGIILEKRENPLSDFTDEDDASSFTRQVKLEPHCLGVGDLAKKYAERLEENFIDDICLGGQLHDIGKADPRFQTVLYGGDRTATQRHEPLLAKSAINISNPAKRQAIRKSANLPKGDFRHECYSVGIIDQNKAFLVNANDQELVRFIVGSHHGRGRPLMPSIDDPGMKSEFEIYGNKVAFKGQHQLERLDSGWVDLFWKLIRRYGYWGLAYLETILRLADHRQSEKGE